MKKLLACFMVLILMFSTGCGIIRNEGNHICVFKEKVESEQYLKLEASCLTSKQYYYSCTCGKHGTSFFTVGKMEAHQYVENPTEEYLKSPATCISPSVYYKSCKICGKKGNQILTFNYGELGECSFTQEVVQKDFLKEEATFTTPEIFYKSCICGKKGTETFSYGAPLKSDYTEEERASYMPTSLTVTLYDAENSIYGFTYNTQVEPLRPVIQIEKGNELTENYEEYYAHVESAGSYDKNNELFTYYVVKTEVKLDDMETYTYRAYDKYVDVGTETVTFTTKNTKSTSFTFAHISDSQMNDSSGEYLNQVLSNMDSETSFVVHTGDFVQYAKYENEWKDMLHSNFDLLSKIPVMAVAGNHDVWSGYGGTHETYKHFNYKLSEQDTKSGIYYSFIYGNAKFIMINNSNDMVTQEQYEWIEGELKNNQSFWTIVAMHQPLYSPGKWGLATASLQMRTQLQGLFAEYGVDIVLQGHDHVVSRTYPINKQGQSQAETMEKIGEVEYSVNPDGVIYVMNGPAGDQSREPVSINSSLYHYARGSYSRSWAEFTIDGNILLVEVKYYDGTQVKNYYTWGIKNGVN